MDFKPKDMERFERLRALSPLEAVQAWLDFAFGIGDETALIEAIRKDNRVTCSEAKIEDVIMNAMDKKLSAAVCLERLVKAK